VSLRIGALLGIRGEQLLVSAEDDMISKSSRTRFEMIMMPYRGHNTRHSAWQAVRPDACFEAHPHVPQGCATLRLGLLRDPMLGKAIMPMNKINVNKRTGSMTI
jgi:hypothetical protein